MQFLLRDCLGRSAQYHWRYGRAWLFELLARPACGLTNRYQFGKYDAPSLQTGSVKVDNPSGSLNKSYKATNSTPCVINRREVREPKYTAIVLVGLLPNTNKEMKMWRYGLVVKKIPDSEGGMTDWYEVKELYSSKDDGVYDSWTEDGIVPEGESKQEVLEVLQMMIDDVKKFDPIFEPENGTKEDD